MFLLIRLLSRQCRKSDLTLHSTMFLLIPEESILFHSENQTLHSTMFLLILTETYQKGGLFIFTFHNVSINTNGINTNIMQTGFFTFHNVSINTDYSERGRKRDSTLHSTMFLLIRQKASEFIDCGQSLHSTMFLLIH